MLSVKWYKYCWLTNDPALCDPKSNALIQDLNGQGQDGLQLGQGQDNMIDSDGPITITIGPIATSTTTTTTTTASTSTTTTTTTTTTTAEPLTTTATSGNTTEIPDQVCWDFFCGTM